MFKELEKDVLIEINGGIGKVLKELSKDAIKTVIVDGVIDGGKKYVKFLKNQDYTYNPKTYKHPYRTDLN